jgi:hypothetical protein
MKKLSLIAAIILLASVTVLGVVFGNHGNNGYNGNGSEDGLKAGSDPLGTLIITGAGHFIQSHALFQQFLHKIELADIYGVDYNELRGILNETLVNIENAGTTYYDFIKLAAVTPYNQDFIDALRLFDYEGFKEANNLNAVILSRLASLLRSGNLTGVFEDIHAKTGEISNLLNRVKSMVDKDIFPGIPILWQINQVYFDEYLFGQYAAMVFNNVREK